MVETGLRLDHHQRDLPAGYRVDPAPIGAGADSRAIISSSDNDNPTLPLLLKCFDTL
jgi:hypothetical protein